MGILRQEDEVIKVKENEEALVLDAIDGNRYALEKLVTLYQYQIFKFAYSRTQNNADAEEITQDTFIQIYKNIHTLKNPSSFKSWIFSIARNLSINNNRKNKRVILLPSSPTENSDNESIDQIIDSNSENNLSRTETEDYVFYKQNREFLIKKLNAIHPNYREVIFMFYFEDKPYKDIAAILNISIGTVKSRLNRGLEKLARGSENWNINWLIPVLSSGGYYGLKLWAN